MSCALKYTHTQQAYLEGTQYCLILSLFYGSYAVQWITETLDLHPAPAPLAVSVWVLVVYS